MDELQEVLTRQRDAAGQVEARLRAIELLLAAGEPRFLPLAVDEANVASERLAALELTRSIAVAAAGVPSDATASDLVRRFPADRAADFEDLVVDLRATVERVGAHRERLRAQLVTAQADVDQRMSLAELV